MFFVLFYLTIKVKHRFWSTQPVFHIYNIFYWLFPPGIIQTKHPTPSKYYDPTIFHKNFNDVSKYEIEQVVELIKNHYLKSRFALYNPPINGFTSYLTGHREACFLSTVEHTKDLFNYHKREVYKKNTCVSAMTSRPLYVKIQTNKKGGQYENITMSYVDFLCTSKETRKKGITPKIIYSHYLNTRKAKGGCSCFIFKREGPQSIFVPLVVYKSYLFDTRKWYGPKKMHPSLKVIKNTPQNLHLLQTFINDSQNKGYFKVLIQPELTNIADLVKTKNLFIYSILHNDIIKAVYFFRNAHTSYALHGQTKLLPSIELFCSINSFDDTQYLLFFNGFTKALQLIIKDHPEFGLLLIEDISHNGTIMKNVFSKYKAYSETNNGYYLYNFAMRPVLSSDALIIS